VDEGVDTGAILLQASVPVLDDDTPETLSARILEREHRLYPEAIALFFSGELRGVRNGARRNTRTGS
jgi:phosphoribosylglycinamide formyltransferase-1